MSFLSFKCHQAMQPDTDSDMTVSTDSGDDQTVTHTGTSETKEESKVHDLHMYFYNK